MEVQGKKREITDFRNFFAGEGGGVGKPEEGGLNICKIVYWEKGEGGLQLQESGSVFCMPFHFQSFSSEDFSWRLGKNPSSGNNLVIAEIFSFSPDK